MKRRILVVLLIVLAHAALFVQPTAAADYRSVLSVRVYRNLLATGDRFFLVHYDVHYDSIPTTELAKYYTFRLYNSGGTLIGTTSPFGYFHTGYDEGVLGFYFGAVGAPTWGDAAVVRIEGSPLYFTSPFPAVNYGISAAEYCTSTDQTINRTQLAAQLISVAQSLETDWSIELVTTAGAKTVMNTTGTTYYTRSVANIQYMAPDAFAVSTNSTNTTARSWTNAQALLYEQRYAGTWVETAVNSAGGLFNVEGNLVTGAGVLVLCIALVGLAQRKWQNADAGLLAAVVVFLVASLAGFVAWAIVGIATVLAALYVTMRVVWRHGT